MSREYMLVPVSPGASPAYTSHLFLLWCLAEKVACCLCFASLQTDHVPVLLPNGLACTVTSTCFRQLCGCINLSTYDVTFIAFYIFYFVREILH